MIKKITIFILVFQMIFPGALWAQIPQMPAAQSAQKIPENNRPNLLIDGMMLPDAVMSNLPTYKNYFFDAFSDQQHLKLVDRAQIEAKKRKAKPTPQINHDNFLVKARETLAKGKKSYQQLDFESALDHLMTSEKEFILNLSHLRSNRDLLEAHLYLGMSYIALTQNAKSEEEKKRYSELAEVEFEKVVMLDPQRVLASRTFSPKVIEVHEKVKRRLVSGNRITVKIEANVPSSTVYVNGKLLGSTPLKAQLIPGEYYVMAEQNGMKPWTKLVKFKNIVEHLTIKMEQEAESDDWNGMFQIREGMDQQSADMEEIDGLANLVGADMVLLSNLEKLNKEWRILGQLYDVRTHEFSQTAMVHVGPIDEIESATFDLAEGLASMIRYDGYLASSQKTNLMGVDPARIAPAQPQVIQEHAASKTAFYKKWWFWLGVAALGGGAYYGIQHYGGTSGSSITINNEGNY